MRVRPRALPMIGEGSHEKLVEKLGAGALCGMAVDSIRFFFENK